MSQVFDLKNSLNGESNITNFHKLLFDLILKADNHNLYLLRQAFPNAVDMVEEYKKNGVIIDLPYD